MKTNEAPDKIYLYSSDRAGEEYEAEWGDKPWGEDCVEYTRTDAFIEKAVEWWMDNFVYTYDVDIKYKNIEDFRNYLKGESL
jgi:hypothetical protein